ELDCLAGVVRHAGARGRAAHSFLFIAWLWPIRQVWLSFWGLLLLVGVVWAGILWPLTLHRRPVAAAAGAFRNPAVMVLIGGFLLRVVILLSSNGIQHETVTAIGR